VAERKKTSHKGSVRKKTQKISVAFFQALFKNALDFTAVIDKTGKIKFHTATVRGFLGYMENELKGVSIFDYIHPDDLKEIKKAFLELVRVPMRVVTREFRFRHKNGTYRWIESTGFNMIKDPAVKGIVVNSRDVHDRRHAEELLRQSENRYRALAEASKDMIFIIDRTDTITYINTICAEWLGLPAREVIGKKRGELFTGRIGERQRENLNGVIKSGEPMYIEEELRYKDKECYIGSWLIPLRNNNGEIDAVMGVARDISAQKNLEKALSREKEFTEALIRSLPGVFFLFDENLRYIMWQDNTTAPEKYTFEEISKMSPFDFIVESEREKVASAFQEVLTRGHAAVEVDTYTRSGSIMSIFANAVRLDIEGKRFILGVGFDVTDKRLTEKKLQERETLFRGIIENTNEIFTIINSNGEMVYMSPSIKKIMGFEAHELTGKNAFDFVHPDDFHILADAIRDVVEKPGKVVVRQMRMKHKDGSWRFIESTGYNLLHDPIIKGIVINSRDVTEQKELERAILESEAKFRNLVEKSLVGVYIIQEGKFAYVNPKFSEIFGYSQKEIMSDITVPDLVAEEDRDLVNENIRKRINGEVESMRYQFRGKRKDGTRIFVEVYGTRTEYSGKPAVIGTIIDYTEQKRMQEQLFQSQKLEAVGRLAGGIAHDFNNLLTLIMLHSEIILKQLGEANEVAQSIKEIYDSAQRASNLTAQLLSFARRQIVEPVVFNANTLIKGLSKMLKSLIGEHIVLETILSEDLYSIKVDPAQLEHAIINLAINSRDAMPGGGKLIIETRNVELDVEYTRTHQEVTPGEYVMIAVSDNGTGMDEETKSKIFEPFFTTKKNGKGTGLGLATVYGFVKQSGGHIWVYSELGKGTTIKVYFPAFKEKPEEIRREKPSKLHGTETILFAEDEPGIRELIVKILTSSGYKVIEASDGIDALEKAKAYDGEIDLLLTDLIMPRLGGKELYDRLKKDREGIEVLFISGYTDNVIVHNFVIEDGTNFLQKPFKPDDLLAKIRSILDRK